MSSTAPGEVGVAGGVATEQGVAHGRIRSKTFEEYERDTTDAWDEEEVEEEDITQLSVPAKLEYQLKQQQQMGTVGSMSDSAATPPRRREGKTKGQVHNVQVYYIMYTYSTLYE